VILYAPPEVGNLIAKMYVGVTNIPYFVNHSSALVGLTYTYDKMHGIYNIEIISPCFKLGRLIVSLINIYIWHK
jgi:hypothetical protein